MALATVEEVKFNSSKDGTEIQGFITTPPGWHGGPQRRRPSCACTAARQSQFDMGWNREWQIFAAHGYVVADQQSHAAPPAAARPFPAPSMPTGGPSRSQDVLGLGGLCGEAKGVADPDRLGVGGWSYGGILTNYVITADHRFKAATSGASISNVLAGYGTDQYVRDYEMELGRPWEHPEVWMKISDPFLHADRIKTPTLFLAGDKDFNVPLLNSEQMYQAVRSQGVATRLIIYPGQFHGLTRPSFLLDRTQRYLGWYDQYLGKPGS